MRITCPGCGTGYDVADQAVGAQGRKVRCRACGTSWIEPPRPALAPDLAAGAVPAPEPVVPAPVPAPPASSLPQPAAPAAVPPFAEAPPPRRRLRAPLLALALVIVALVLGAVILGAIWGPQRLVSSLGLAEARVPLGIAITKEPDWREIAGGSELFAVSGRIWNPTAQVQPVPDVQAEIKDKAGRTIRQWTIARPARQLAPGAHVDFDGAAIDVPRESATVALSFVGERK